MSSMSLAEYCAHLILLEDRFKGKVLEIELSVYRVLFQGWRSL